MKRSLSPVQVQVFAFMREFFAENDQLPPALEISNRFGWKRRGNAVWHLHQLHVNGYIEPNATGKYRFARNQLPPVHTKEQEHA